MEWLNVLAAGEAAPVVANPGEQLENSRPLSRNRQEPTRCTGATSTETNVAAIERKGLNMRRVVIAALFMVVSLVSAGFSDDEDASQSGLDRLKSFGYIVTDDGIEEHSPRFVVPHDSTVTPAAIEELLQYCIATAPTAEVIFLSPAVVEEQLRQFRQFLPHAHIRHAPAVWFGAHFLVCLPDGINDVCRIEGFDRGAPAAEWGLQKGDIILGIGEFRWPEAKSLDSFSFAIKRQVPGEESTVIVKRNNEILSFSVTWRTLPQSKNPLLRPQ